MQNTPSVQTDILSPMREGFDGDLRARKRVEAILDHKKYYNNEDFFASLNKQLQSLYGKDATIQVLKRSHSGRYFNMIDRSEVVMSESDAGKIAHSTMKPQAGSDGFYTQIFADSPERASDALIIKISGIEAKDRDQVLRGMRELREQFRKTHTAIDIQNQDALTGLYNRYFLERYALERDAREDRNYAIIFVDLVNLKGHNNVGYDIGDAAIKKFAELLKMKFPRKSDLVVRASGDEFAVILEFPKGMTYKDQKRIVDGKMEELKEELEMGEDGRGTYLLKNTPRTISMLWGAAYRKGGKKFWELYNIAGEHSKMGKTLDGVAARAEEGSRELIPTIPSLLSLTQAIGNGLDKLYGIDASNKDIVVDALKDVVAAHEATK